MSYERPWEEGDQRETCGFCGEEVDCFGVCDCPGALADRTKEEE